MLDLKKFKPTLVKALESGLPRVEVNNKMFLKRGSALFLSSGDMKLPQGGERRDYLDTIIGEFPLYTFLSGEISRDLYENQKYDSDCPEENITNLPAYVDVRGTAERLIDEFLTLPWKYSLSIKMENDFSTLFAEKQKEFIICDSLALVTPTEDFIQEHPSLSGIEGRDKELSPSSFLLSFDINPIEWDQGSTYLQIKTEGYIDRYGSTATHEGAVSLLKSFCGLAIALRILKPSGSFKLSPVNPSFYIHRNINDNWIIEETIDLDSHVSETFTDLVINDLKGKLKTDEHKILWIRKQLELIKCVFTNKEKAEKLILASQWFYESYCVKSDLLAFIQTSVAFEIILGDEKAPRDISLGKLLSNRCAYLIATDRKQRKEILEGFKEIYNIRSKIVHAGHSKLTSDDRALFSQMRWMFRRVIQEEVKLLKAETENDKKAKT